MEFYTSVRKLGKNILYRGIDENGKRVCHKIEYQPTLYVKDFKTQCEHKSLYNDPLKPIQFESIYAANEFTKQYKDIQNFEIFGENRYEYAYIAEQFFGKEIEYDFSKLRIFSLDIETKLETNTGFPNTKNCAEEVSLITIYDSKTNKLYGFGQYPFYNKNSSVDVEYFHCIDEVQLLKRFIQFWSNNYPEICIDWNGRLFDIPYLVRRITKILDEKEVKKLSPFGYIGEKLETIGNNEYYIYDIYGIEHLDYLDLYKKFTYVTRESYKLDHIVYVELGKRKVHNPYPTFREHYEKDWESFVEYCCTDTMLVWELNQKLRLVELVCTLAYLARCNFSDTLSPVKMWEIILYNRLLSKNTIPHFKTHNDLNVDVDYAGAYVKEPEKGLQEWIVSYDVSSMYPHICMQYNISPETIVEGKLPITVDKMLNHDISEYCTEYAITANGIQYRKDIVGILPEMMEFYFNKRKETRKILGELKKTKQTLDKNSSEYIDVENRLSSLDVLQMAFKIAINSLYGAAANKYFLYYDVRLAESITLTGQVAIQWVAKDINTYLNKMSGTTDEQYISYIDTDSNYFSLKSITYKYLSNITDDYEIAKYLDKICNEKISPLIDRSFNRLSTMTNCTKNRLSMSRENIGRKAFWTAKKKYAMSVIDQDGIVYTPPKLKVMGLEIVRSSTPEFVRNSLSDCVEIILTKDVESLRNYVSEFKTKFYGSSVDDIAFPRGINNIDKYYDPLSVYKKGCPIHVRGSILHNTLVKKLKLEEKYNVIKDGDKIKFVYLITPNHLRENVVSWIGEFPEEFSLTNYVDYGTMYKKVFLEPLESMINSISWQLEEKLNLEDLFG